MHKVRFIYLVFLLSLVSSTAHAILELTIDNHVASTPDIPLIYSTQPPTSSAIVFKLRNPDPTPASLDNVKVNLNLGLLLTTGQPLPNTFTAPSNTGVWFCTIAGPPGAYVCDTTSCGTSCPALSNNANDFVEFKFDVDSSSIDTTNLNFSYDSTASLEINSIQTDSITHKIQVIPYDLAMTFLSPTGTQTVDLSNPPSTGVDFEFRLSSDAAFQNNISVSFSENDTSFTLDPNSIAPANGTIGWTCTGSTCIYNNPFSSASTATFTGKITAFPSPSATTTYSNIVKAEVFDITPPIDNSASNNSALGLSINVIPVNAQPDFDLVQAATQSTYNALEGQISIGIPFQITLSGSDAPNGEFRLNNVSDTNFTLFNSNQIPAGWSCTQSSSHIKCKTNSTVTNGSTLDFNLNLGLKGLNTNIPTPVGSYPFTADIVSFASTGGTNSIPITLNVNAHNNIALTTTKSITNGTFTDTNISGRLAHAGTQITYKIITQNNLLGIKPVNIDLTDLLPAGLSYVSSNAVGNFNSCTENAGSITCHALSLPDNNNGTGDYIEVTATVTGNVGDTIVLPEQALTLNNGNHTANNVSSDLTFTIVGLVDPSLVKTSFKADASTPATTFNNNESFVYQLKVNNTGGNLDSIPVNSLLVEDTLVTGLTFDGLHASSNSDWDCSQSSGQFVRCTNNVAIASNGSNNLNILVHGTNTTNSTLSLNNTASVNLSSAVSNYSDSDTSNNQSANVSVTINPANINLTFTKNVIGGTDTDNDTYPNFAINDAITYKLKFSNGTGGASFNDLELVDTLPTNLQLDNASLNLINGSSTFNCTPNNNTITCTTLSGQNFNSGAIFELEYQATATTAGNDISNSATLSSQTHTFSSTETAVIDIDSNQTTLGIVKTASVTNIDKGLPFVYEISVSNTGSNTASNVQVIDTMPAGLSSISFDSTASAAGWSCTNNALIYTCNLSSLVVSASSLLVFNVTSDANTSLSQLDNGATATAANDAASTPVENHALVNLTTPNTTTTLSIVKTASVTSIEKGQTFSYEISVDNTGSNIANNVVVTDTMPQGLSSISLDSSSSQAGWNCNNAALVYTCNLTSLAVNGNSVLKFNVDVASSTTFTSIINSASVTANNDSNTNPTPVNVAVSLTNPPVTSYTINMNQTPAIALEGQSFILDILVQNTSTISLPGVVIENTLPQGFSYAQAQNNNCTVDNQNTLLINCPLTNAIAANSTSTVSLNVVAISPVPNNTIFTDNATITGTNISSGNSSLDLQVSATNQGAVFSIIDSKDPVNIGEAFDYILSIANTDSNALTFVDFNIAVPNDLNINSLTSMTGLDCTTSNNLINCVANNSFSINANDTTQAVVINTQSTSFEGTLTVDVVSDNISIASEQTTIINPIDLAIVKSSSKVNLIPNENYSYTLSVSNTDPNKVATNIVVTDELPQGVSLQSIDSGMFNCNATSPISCQLGSLDEGVSEEIIIHVTAPSTTGTFTNTALVNGQQSDNNTSNNSSSVDVIVSTQVPDVGDLVISKSASQVQVANNESITWNIQVKNNGPDSMMNVEITDNLPNGFTFSSTNNSACSLNNTTVLCTFAQIANQQTLNIEISGIVTIEEGILTNNVSITSSTNDANTANNTASASVIVQNSPSADVAISDISSAADINQGDETEFNVSLINHGSNSASSASVELAITGIIDTISVLPDSHWDCGNSSELTASTVQCNYNGEMPSGTTSHILLKARTSRVVQQAESIELTAHITAQTDDPNLANNTATASVNVTGTPTEEQILAAMRQALGGSASAQTQQAIQNVASYCARSYFTALESLCDDIYATSLAGDGETINKIMTEITPNEVIGQSTSVAEIATAQFRNVGARLSQIRGGGGSGFSSSGLTARYGNGGIPLNMLAYLNKSNEKTDGISKVEADFVSPWGFFVNGTISMGKRDATGKELGFDFDTYGLTAGFDYRLSRNKIIGVALGYANFDSKIDHDTAKLKSTGLTLTAYGSFEVGDNFYLDARISYGKPQFDMARNIDFSIGDTHIQRTANSNTSANQYSVALSGGYSFYKNAWSITPNGSVRYTKTNINSFSETGAGDFNFFYGSQTWDSLLWSAGLRVSKAISLKNGVITPQFDFDYNYESLNDGKDIEARFIMAPSDEIFIITTDSPDRSYGSAGLGLVYISANGKQAYINYKTVLGLQGFSKGTFNLGARFEF